MQTIKTSIVVVLLLAVLYGAYTVINQPPPQLPPEVAEMSTEMWDDQPVVAFSDSDGTQSFQPTFGEPDAAAQANAMPPEMLVAEGETARSPATNLGPASNTGPTSDPATPSPAGAMLAAPQPLSPVGGTQEPSPYSPSVNPATEPSGVPGQNIAAGAVEQVSEVTVVDQANAESTDAPAGTAAAPAHQGAVLAKTFPVDWAKSNALLAERKYTEALRILSPHFGSHDLTAAESERLIAILDPLAGRVIYSREHAVAPPHKIRRGETLYTIAEQYQVPWQLLKNINGVTNPEVLVPGTELKIVRGPFSAQVDVQRSELTLFTDGMYAGRFPISVGSDFTAQAGDYQVQGKSTERAYYGPNNRVLPAGHPENPYGNAWLDLGGDLAIHGSPQTVARGTPAVGAISLSPRDAVDVYGILSKGSTVTILR